MIYSHWEEVNLKKDLIPGFAPQMFSYQHHDVQIASEVHERSISSWDFLKHSLKVHCLASETNQELFLRNQTLSEKNNSIESDIKSMQKSDAHAERFAREELNLIYEDEQYLNFKENDSNEPQS